MLKYRKKAPRTCNHAFSPPFGGPCGSSLMFADESDESTPSGLLSATTSFSSIILRTYSPCLYVWYVLIRMYVCTYARIYLAELSTIGPWDRILGGSKRTHCRPVP